MSTGQYETARCAGDRPSTKPNRRAGRAFRAGLLLLAHAALLAFAALPATAAPPAAAPRQERVLARRAATPDVALRVYNLYGSTRVIAWDRDSIVVTGAVEPRAGRFFVGGDPRAMKLGIEPVGEASDPASWIEVRVPRGSQVWIKAATGNVEVSGVEGGLDLYSVSGSILVRGSPRQVYAESMAGGVTIEARAPWIRARTAGGAIVLVGGGDDIAATSVSGAIRLEGGHVVRARLESVTGGISFTGSLDRGGTYEFETHEGAVELALPSTVEADFEIHAFQGALTSDFESTPGPRGRDLAGKTVEFTTGHGGAVVSIRTFKGNVVLRRTR